MVSNDLARRAASMMCKLTYLGHDLTLTWLDRSNFKLTFQVQKVFLRTGSTRQTRWCHFYFRISHIKKKLIKNVSVKNNSFSFDDLCSQNYWSLGQIWSKNVTGSWGELANTFFEIFLAIILLEIKAIVGKKKSFFLSSNFDLWWHLMTSILTWPENDLC